MSDRPTSLGGMPIHNTTLLRPVSDCGSALPYGDPCDSCGSNDTPERFLITIGWESCETDCDLIGSQPPTTIVVEQSSTDPCFYYGCKVYGEWTLPDDPCYEFITLNRTGPRIFTVSLTMLGGDPPEWGVSGTYPDSILDPLMIGSECCEPTYASFTATGAYASTGVACTDSSSATTITPDGCESGSATRYRVTSLTITPTASAADGGTCIGDVIPEDPDDPPNEECCTLCQNLTGEVNLETCVVTGDVCDPPGVVGPDYFYVTFCKSMIPGAPTDLGFLECAGLDPDGIFTELLEERTYECTPPECDDPYWGDNDGPAIYPPRNVILRKTGTCTWSTDPTYTDNPYLNVTLTLSLVAGGDALPPSSDDCVILWTLTYLYTRRLVGAVSTPCLEAECPMFISSQVYSLTGSTAACSGGTEIINFYAQESVNPFFVLPESCGCEMFVNAKLVPFNAP